MADYRQSGYTMPLVETVHVVLQPYRQVDELQRKGIDDNIYLDCAPRDTVHYTPQITQQYYGSTVY